MSPTSQKEVTILNPTTGSSLVFYLLSCLLPLPVLSQILLHHLLLESLISPSTTYPGCTHFQFSSTLIYTQMFPQSASPWAKFHFVPSKVSFGQSPPHPTISSHLSHHHCNLSSTLHSTESLFPSPTQTQWFPLPVIPGLFVLP